VCSQTSIISNYKRWVRCGLNCHDNESFPSERHVLVSSKFAIITVVTCLSVSRNFGNKYRKVSRELKFEFRKFTDIAEAYSGNPISAHPILSKPSSGHLENERESSKSSLVFFDHSLTIRHATNLYTTIKKSKRKDRL